MKIVMKTAITRTAGICRFKRWVVDICWTFWGSFWCSTCCRACFARSTTATRALTRWHTPTTSPKSRSIPSTTKMLWRKRTVTPAGSSSRTALWSRSRAAAAPSWYPPWASWRSSSAGSFCSWSYSIPTVSKAAFCHLGSAITQAAAAAFITRRRIRITITTTRNWARFKVRQVHGKERYFLTDPTVFLTHRFRLAKEKKSVKFTAS